MQHSQKYALIQSFQQIDEGELFRMNDWPLHITLVDVFSVSRTANLIHDIQQYIDTQPMAITYIQSEGVLGTTDVWLLKVTPELTAVHLALVDILERHEATFNNPDFTRGGFVPHITKQPGNDMKLSDKIVINITSLVDMFPDSDWQTRKIIKHFTPDQLDQ